MKKWIALLASTTFALSTASLAINSNDVLQTVPGASNMNMAADHPVNTIATTKSTVTKKSSSKHRRKHKHKRVQHSCKYKNK